MAIISDKSYTPQEYAIEYLDAKGRDIREHTRTIEDLREYMDNNGYEDVWDYSVFDVDEALNAGNSLVIVVDPRTSETRLFEVWDDSYEGKYITFGDDALDIEDWASNQDWYDEE